MEDLKEHGVILPEEEWGTHRLETTVPEWTTAATLVGAAAALVIAYVGDGTWLTWGGLGAYLAALYGVTWICDRATKRQRERVRREREEG